MNDRLARAIARGVRSALGRLFMLSCVAGLLTAAQPASRPATDGAAADLLAGRLRWTYGPALLAPAERPADPCYSVKDPTIVWHGGQWHLFCTIRSKVRSHQIEYLRFADFRDAAKAERHVLTISDGYFCAPQVFYFTPHRKWYMVLQVNDPARKPTMQVAFSTTDDVSAPQSWTKPKPLFAEGPDGVTSWIDFWVICDDAKAHLFFTSNDGRMWRSEAKLADFPHGWSKPQVVLEGDIFEASHTYRLKGLDQYLTVIEAQGNGRRYYKAYLADRLDGKWTPAADTLAKAFASPAIARPAEGVAAWTDSFSHGELLRDGNDERLVVDPANLRFLFQGVLWEDMKGKKYGEIPWKLGLLEPVR